MANTAPKDNLVRGVFSDGNIRGANMDPTRTGDGNTLFGHFCVWNSPAVINSWEGRFVETIAPGAFKATLNGAGRRVVVQYNHGLGSFEGQLGAIRDLREDELGMAYEVKLLDIPINRDYVIPAAKEGLLGASFRFQVVRDSWTENPPASSWNPDRLPERLVKEVKLYEFGPVDQPAYEAASAGVRSRDEFNSWVRQNHKIDKNAPNYVPPDRRRRVVEYLKIWS